MSSKTTGLLSLTFVELNLFINFITLYLFDSYVSCIANESNANEKYDGITHLVEHPIQMKPPGMS